MIVMSEFDRNRKFEMNLKIKTSGDIKKFIPWM